MAEPRRIKVFVSSTFRDMQAEREELIKRVFPQVRRMCEERGVGWSEVDLRWGVTDEQKAEGAVLPICLAEIDRSRPYFIGLLGQRYGWVPEQLPVGIVDELPWLAPLIGTSVTEIEILHGVLNDRSSAGHAYFYTRDPAWLASRPLDEQALLGEFESDEEIARLGPEAAGNAAADRRQRLEALKQPGVDAGLASFEYPDPQALGARVLSDFSALIESLFPLRVDDDRSAVEAEAHRAYGHAQRRGHVVRPAIVAAIEAAVSGVGLPVMLSGDPGAGASALASQWVTDWQTAHPRDVIVEHHVGATAESADWSALAARLIVELERGHDFQSAGDPPGDAPGRRTALFAALARAGAADRRTVLFVDGVDLLTDVDGAPDLTWLPKQLPTSVRVVLTAGDERPVVEARRRGWTTVDVPPLDETERRELVRLFLGRYAKGLDEVHVARLVSAPATGNELYLRTVLDELRQHGDHFTIGRVIEHYLAAASLDELLALVLERYEGDFERDRVGLVGDSMRAVWAARRGITEPELLDTLGDIASGGAALPSAFWSPLVLAAEAGLVTQSGRLVFATEPHRRAVERRYLRDDADRRSAHAALAATFATYDLGPRVIDELPWQQLGAGDVDAMVATISDLAFTDAAYRRSPGELRQLWARAEDNGQRVVDAYRSIVADPASNTEMAWQVARLVTDAGYPTEALRLHRYLVDTYRRVDDEVSRRRLPSALVNLGAALLVQGELAAAEPPLQEAINLSRATADDIVLQTALGNLALCRRDCGDIDGALSIFAEEESICRRRGNTTGLQASLGNRSQLLRQRGDYAGALALMGEQEELCRSIGDSTGVARALVGQGTVHSDLGDPTAALQNFVAFRELCEQLGDLRGVAEGSINEVNTLRQIGRRDEAADRAEQAETLIRRLSDEPLLARILDARSRAAIDEGRWDDGRRLATEAVLTARSCGAIAVLMLALGMLGTAERELGDLAAARAAHDEEESLARRLGDTGAVATALVNQASVDIVAGDLGAALGRYAEAEPVLRQLGVQMALLPLCSNRWQVHARLGDTTAAIDDLVAGGRSAAAIGSLTQSQQMLTQAAEMMYAAGRGNECESVWSNLAEVC